MSMKNSNDTIGNRTRGLPTCSAVPLPTAPPRTTVNYIKYIFKTMLCESVGIIKLRLVTHCSLDSSNHDFSKLRSVRANAPKSIPLLCRVQNSAEVCTSVCLSGITVSCFTYSCDLSFILTCHNKECE